MMRFILGVGLWSSRKKNTVTWLSNNEHDILKSAFNVKTVTIHIISISILFIPLLYFTQMAVIPRQSCCCVYDPLWATIQFTFNQALTKLHLGEGLCKLISQNKFHFKDSS